MKICASLKRIVNNSVQQKLTELEALVATQRDCQTDGPAGDYMHGMLNGMIIAHSVFTGDRPKYYSKHQTLTKNKIRHKCRR